MGKANKNKSLIAKFICLLLSFGLWLYISNVENPVRTYELKGVPVELTNKSSISDVNLAIVNDQNFTVDLKLEGASSEIYKAKKESFKLVADMGAYALKNGENLIPIQVVSYPENINIKNNGFLGIKVKLESLISKDVSLKSQVKIFYKENVYKKEQSISPEKVTISGPESAVNRVQEGVLVGSVNDLDKDVEKNYDIKFLDKDNKEVTGITSNYNEAQLAIKVSNGKSVPITIKTTGNLNQGLSIVSMDLSSKMVHIIGDNQNLDKITSIETEAINLSELNSDKEINVNLSVPKGVTVQKGSEMVKVKVTLNKDINVTKDISCKVEYNNLNKEFVIESYPETATVTISGLQSVLDKFTANDIKAVVDLSNITEEGSYKNTPTTIISDNTGIAVISVQDVQVVVKKKV